MRGGSWKRVAQSMLLNFYLSMLGAKLSDLVSSTGEFHEIDLFVCVSCLEPSVSTAP